MTHYITIDDHHNNLNEAIATHTQALEAARKLILEHAGFVCVHQSKSGYCDDCPISTNGKWKREKVERPSREVSALLCDKTRYYSK